MKNYLYLMLIAVFAFSVSCDKIKDATAVDIETDLSFEIPVESTGQSALVAKSGNLSTTAYQFGGNATFSLSDNEDIADYVNKIDDIIVSGISKIQIIDVPTDGKISTCKLMYGVDPNAGTTGFNVTTELTAVNGIIEITDKEWVNQFIILLKQNKTGRFKFVVTGEASYDIQSVMKIKIPVLIEANAL
ncbi:MAG: hypothetical protein IPF54_23625 [Draconibacterium sp.]|nr:hypothetical protein [Draconibacterium sp.]